MSATARIVRVADVPPQPWKNGGGVTRELLALPGPGSGPLDWQVRLSLADIERDGPFSPFPGVERWFVVLEGMGVALDFAGHEQVQRVGDAPLCFDGAAAPGCRLIEGPTRDLNLMLRGASGGLCPVVAGEPWRPRAAGCGLFTLAGGVCRVDGVEPVFHVPGQALLWFDEAPQQLNFCTGSTGPAWWIAATPKERGA